MRGTEMKIYHQVYALATGKSINVKAIAEQKAIVLN
ncbi:unnamed protein product, partial [Arabidopsis halleri]